jgi:hypothetical protein
MTYRALGVNLVEQTSPLFTRRPGSAEATANRVVAAPASDGQQCERSKLNGKITHQEMKTLNAAQGNRKYRRFFGQPPVRSLSSAEAVRLGGHPNQWEAERQD